MIPKGFVGLIADLCGDVMAAFESPTLRSYRELLDVGEQASVEDLKKAYYRMALLYHPDRNQDPNAPQIFSEIKKAYDVLADPERVRWVNRTHFQDQLSRNVVEDLQITFGSFFGHRLFRFPGLIEKRFRLGQEISGESDTMPSRNETFREGQSILDHPAYDSIELVYAGKFSKDDEAQLVNSFSGQNVLSLPWVTINHRGIYHFLRDELEDALRCYEDLNRRISNNIIFMYRLGILEVLLGFRERKSTWFGGSKPNERRVRRGIRWLEHCLKIGRERPVGRQNCLVIRKTLAEIYDRMGHRRKSRRLWLDVQKREPKSLETAFRLGGWSEAKTLFQAQRKRSLKSRGVLPEAKAKNKQS